MPHLNLRTRLLAIVAAAALIAAGFMAAEHRPPAPRTHPLGMRGLELAALQAKTKLYFRGTPITPTTPAAEHHSDIALTGIGWNLTKPIDVDTGQPTGRAQIGVFTMVKHLDRATPLIEGAFGDDEVLKQAEVFAILPNAVGTSQILSFTFTGAVVASDRITANTSSSTETFTISFQRVEVTYTGPGGTTHASLENLPA